MSAALDAGQNMSSSPLVETRGIGGALLSLAYTQIWVDNMTAGRGWITLAMVIFGTWDPVRTALGAYLFGRVQACQV
jgi:general nucleoside transport system permease protein